MLSAALLDGPQHLVQPLLTGRKTYLQVARGSLRVNGVAVSAGDGIKIEHEPLLDLSSGQKAEVLVFDLPE